MVSAGLSSLEKSARASICYKSFITNFIIISLISKIIPINLDSDVLPGDTSAGSGGMPKIKQNTFS